MIEYIKGDIFQSPAQVLVNTVNTVGVMGKGLALEFKKRYPKMFEEYRNACEHKKLSVGKLMLWYGQDHWVLLFPTKQHWRYPSELSYIENGLIRFVETYAKSNISSIAFPKLGCGNGELDWNNVKPIMEKYLKPLPIKVYIYIGLLENSKPEHNDQEKTVEWLRSHSRDLSFNGLKDDIVYSSSIAPIEFDFKNRKYSAAWRDGALLVDGFEKIVVLEEDLYAMWNSFRTAGIVQRNDNDIRSSAVLALLSHLNYVNPVNLIKDDESKSFVAGYQVNEGAGRLFALRGE